MKLLIITQKVDINDSNLGFFHRWLKKFSEKLDKLYIICLVEGKHSLPKNTEVFSLGKEKSFSKIKQLFLLQKFLFKHLSEVDGIFIHMCPIYIIASFLLAKIFRKKIILWYAHVKPSFLVKIAKNLALKILTPSKESFASKTKNRKLIITGHGIDVSIFKPANKLKIRNKKVILSTGRIAPVKDLKTLIEAMDILVKEKKIKNIKTEIIGDCVEGYEERYYKELQNLIKNKKLKRYVKFLKGFPNQELAKFYQEADIFVNMQSGGGAGKAVLEAMASGIPVVLCTKTFNELLGDFKKEIIFKEKNPQDLSLKLLNCLNFPRDKRKKYSNLLRNIVVKNHNLDNLIDKILNEFKI